MTKLTEEKYIKEMKKDCFSGDYELNHSFADKILLKFLKQLGYKKLVKLFESVDKWYA